MFELRFLRSIFKNLAILVPEKLKAFYKVFVELSDSIVTP